MRQELITAIEQAKSAMDANRTPETMQAYADARNAHGDWLRENGHYKPGRLSRVRSFQRQYNARMAKYI